MRAEPHRDLMMLPGNLTWEETKFLFPWAEVGLSSVLLFIYLNFSSIFPDFEYIFLSWDPVDILATIIR